VHAPLFLWRLYDDQSAVIQHHKMVFHATGSAAEPELYPRTAEFINHVNGEGPAAL
jgi:hypothetical protein